MACLQHKPEPSASLLPPLQQPGAALPPPPPPVRIVGTPNHLYQRKPLDLQEEVEYLLRPFLSDGDESKNVVVTCVWDINPVIQDGPMCGLVALSMASQLLHEKQMIPVHPDTLLDFARENGFSKQGEMFSIDYMLQIAEQHMDCCGRSTHTHSLDVNTVMLSILQREAILVPYDADKNHSPCLAKGHKAHWCILVGFAAVLNRDVCTEAKEVLQLLEYCTPNPRLSGHYQMKRKEFGADFVRILLSTVETDAAELYVFARHGKSRHIGLWSYRELKQSNGNLVEVGPQISYPGEYIVPHGGINEGLCSKVLILSKQK